MKICILDDEHIAAEYLKELLQDSIKNYTLNTPIDIYSFSRSDILLDFVRCNKPEIIFLDIEMPGISGLEVAKTINKNKVDFGYSSDLPFIIMSTAHTEYGYDAYQNDVFDYLLKPVSEERIDKTLNKLFDKIGKTNRARTLTVNNNGIDVLLRAEDIVYLKADMKYIQIKTKAKSFIISDTLNNLEETLTDFVRVHRGYLVNVKFLDKFFQKDGHWYLSLKETEEIIPVSRRYKSQIDGKLFFRT